MKTILKKTSGLLLLSFVFFFLVPVQSKACEIKFEVSGTKKQLYHVGDEVIIKVKVILNHPFCRIGVNETEFDTNGLQILSTTNWQEVNPGIWECKMQLKVTGNKTGKLTVKGTRTCSKEGGFGSISLNSEPVKK